MAFETEQVAQTEKIATATELPSASKEHRWRTAACFVLLLAAIQLTLGPKLRLSQWEVDAESNAAVAEGEAWLSGRLDLPHKTGTDLLHNRLHDTAYYNDKVYNVFPPMMAFLTVALHPVHAWLGLPAGFWLPWPYELLVFWPLPIVGFVVFKKQVRHPAWAALLTLAWMGGTAVLPNLHEAQTGLLGQINHVISQVGLLILAADILGKQRIWPGLIGIAISTCTRQLTFLYGLPLLWVAWRRGRLAGCLAGLFLIAVPLLTLNWLKFDSPLDFGYRHIYAGREDDYMGERCLTYGTFSPRFIADNAYYMHVAPPSVEWSLTYLKIADSNQNGTSLWITTPLALFVFISVPVWWRDRARRVLMLGTLPVMFGLLCYHSPGYMEHGYNRFALDFLPIWLAVVAPATMGRRRTWFTLGLVAWSLLYFQAIVPDGPARDIPPRYKTVGTPARGTRGQAPRGVPFSVASGVFGSEPAPFCHGLLDNGQV
jgi:hypothetical protein